MRGRSRRGLNEPTNRRGDGGDGGDGGGEGAVQDGWREKEGSEGAGEEKKTITYCCRRANSSCQALTHCGSTGPLPEWRTNKAPLSQNTRPARQEELPQNPVMQKIHQISLFPNVCHWPVSELPGVKEKNAGPVLLLRKSATHHTVLESSPEVIDASSNYDI